MTVRRLTEAGFFPALRGGGYYCHLGCFISGTDPLGLFRRLPRGMIMLFLFLSAFPSPPDADASLRDVNVREEEIPSGSSSGGGPGDEEVLRLVERAKAGDEDAFASLVNQYERFVYNAACRILSASAQPLDMAEDVSQETFVKAWRNLGKFRGDCTFSTWLFRIAVNCAKDAVRSAARRPAASLSFAGEEDEDGASEWDIPVTSGDTVPEDAVERRELILAVRRAVEALPEDQRQVVVMRDLSGLPYQEIADTLGIELGTVKSRLNRGRANLKTILENGNFL